MNKIALTNVRVFDGMRLLEPATVVIDGMRIGSDPAGATTAEGDGRVLLPGLIDCHIHLTDDATLAALARHGVTTALDMGTWPPELVASLRGRPGVADVRSSGTGATHPASAHAQRMGRAQGLVADPDEAKAYVSQRVAEGVDGGGRMKIITIEEHVLDPAVARASAATAQQLSPYFGAAFGPDSGLPYSPSADVLCDLDEGRIADTLVAAVRRHPDRFAAFAALPTTVPDAAAAELERCVGDLGFVGTMIMGRTEGEFLSAERFDPVLGGVFDRYPALQVILGH